LFPFTLGGDAKIWYNSLAPHSITSQEECLCQFFDKYLPASKVHALTLDISNFSQKGGEDLPQAWGRYHDMTRNYPSHGFKANELLDIFYNGLTEGTRCYLDRTIEEATELLDTIVRNYEDWKMEETNEEELFSEKNPGILKLTDETMKEADTLQTYL
jgi:hypothetical protein